MSDENVERKAGRKVGSYRDLLVWRKSIELAKLIYSLTRNFPAEEKYGLTGQMRRAAVSIPSNIAEGQARRGSREFCQFISVAEGSLAELDTQLVLSAEFCFGDPQQIESASKQVDELRRKLNALRRKIELSSK